MQPALIIKDISRFAVFIDLWHSVAQYPTELVGLTGNYKKSRTFTINPRAAALY